MKKINPQLNKLLTILNDGAFHDGDALGIALNVTRAAIWKMIEKLKDYGINILSIKGKGYQLEMPLLLLDTEKIIETFAGSGVHIAIFDSISSTNDYLKTYDHVDHNRLDIALAETQTEGRGRFNRTWVSPYAQNIYLSCRYLFDKDLSELGGLSLVAGLAIVECLKGLGFTQGITIKWPNDVMWNGKKMAGILVEIRAEAHGLSEVIIGIGLNVNLSAAHSLEINQTVASLSEIASKSCDRTVVVIQLIQQLVKDLILFKHAGWALFKSRWEQVDFLRGLEIVLLQGNKKIAGIAQGVDDHGYLLLLQQAGTLQAFSSGEVSVAK